MAAHLDTISKLLDEAAPDLKLVAVIKSSMERIQRDIERYGSAIVVVNGQKYRVFPTTKEGV